MSQIVLFKLAQTDYDSQRLFAEQLGAAFAQEGHGVRFVDLRNGLKDLASAVTPGVDFFVGFNGAGLEIQLSAGTSLYDRLGAPFFAYFVDHPCYHLSRLSSAAQLRQVLVAFPCPWLNEFVKMVFGDKVATTALPLAACSPPAAGDGPRDIEVLFTGSYTAPEPILDGWGSLAEDQRRLCREVLDCALDADGLSLEQAFVQVTRARGVSDIGLGFLTTLFLTLDQYVRARRREDFLQALADGGLVVDVYGNGWETASPGLRRHRFHPPVSLADSLLLMRRAKISLNVSPMFADGGHDRVYSAMLAGSVAATDWNPYWARTFSEDGDLVTYRWSRLGELPDRLHALLAEDERRRAIAERARGSVLTHTWAARARAICDAVARFKSA